MADDRAEIASVIGHLGVLVDRREWRELKALFTEAVEVDYTSLFGGNVEKKSRDALVDGWAAFLPRFTGTEHIIGTAAIEVNGDSARARAPVVGWHFMGKPLTGPSERWVVGGHYDIRLVRQGKQWRITALKLEALWQEGKPPA
jgi:hypothetical protein